MKILYFTSTGNSLYVAKQFDAELLSIPQMSKEGRFDFQDETVGIVYPVYDWGLPKLVRKFMERMEIRASYVFVIATYGNNAGASLHEADKMLKSRGVHADYFESVLMVDDYLPLFDIDKQLAELPQKRVDENLARIAREVMDGKKRKPSASPIWRGVSRVMKAVQPLISNNLPRWTFRVNSKCTSCGTCTRVCPVMNVAMAPAQMPEFGSRCESCLACVHNCPKNAIHLSIERSATRFRNQHVSLKEIISSNDQLSTAKRG